MGMNLEFSSGFTALIVCDMEVCGDMEVANFCAVIDTLVGQVGLQ